MPMSFSSRGNHVVLLGSKTTRSRTQSVTIYVTPTAAGRDADAAPSLPSPQGRRQRQSKVVRTYETSQSSIHISTTTTPNAHCSRIDRTHSAGSSPRPLWYAVLVRTPLTAAAPQVRMASSLLKMPAMSPTMTEGGLAAWKVKEGDSFSAGDVILEVVR